MSADFLVGIRVKCGYFADSNTMEEIKSGCECTMHNLYELFSVRDSNTLIDNVFM